MKDSPPPRCRPDRGGLEGGVDGPANSRTEQSGAAHVHLLTNLTFDLQLLRWAPVSGGVHGGARARVCGVCGGVSVTEIMAVLFWVAHTQKSLLGFFTLKQNNTV